MTKITRKCDVCECEYQAKKSDLKRGWGLCCSKSCASKKRERNKPNYNPSRVKANNIRRKNWNKNKQDKEYKDFYFLEKCYEINNL